MKSIALCLLWVGWLWLGMACKSNEAGLLPQPMNDTLPIEVPFSSFHIPITYPIGKLEQFLNEKISGKFFETTLQPTKNQKDRVKVEMSKLSGIQISSSKGQLVCKVPLHVKATIENSRINFITKGIAPVETDLELELTTPADLDKNWMLVTRFELTRIQWVNPPIVKIAGISFNLQAKLDAYLQKNKTQLTNLLNEALNTSVSLEKPIGKIWRDLQKPILVVKQPPRASIWFVCHSISGDFKIAGPNLVCNTTVKAQVVMVTETRVKPPIIPLPPFKSVPQGKKMSDAHVYAFAGFEMLNEKLGEELSGKKLEGKYLATTIQNVKAYASDSGLTVLLETKGDIDATMAATVQPRFDSVTQTFIMDNFQFRVVTDNVLVNMGDAILHDRVRDTIQTHLALGMDTLIQQVPVIIEQAIAKGKTGKAINMRISDFEIRSCKVQMDAKRLHFLVHTRLKSSIELKHINSGKQIKIKPKQK